MRLTAASLNAVEALICMGSDRNRSVWASHEIAQIQGHPERFLLKSLMMLVKAGILSSNRGPNGGYTLRRPLKDITVLEVVEAVDGPIRAILPMSGERALGKGMNKLQAALDRSAEASRKELDKLKITDLGGRG